MRYDMIGIGYRRGRAVSRCVVDMAPYRAPVAGLAKERVTPESGLRPGPAGGGTSPVPLRRLRGLADLAARLPWVSGPWGYLVDRLGQWWSAHRPGGREPKAGEIERLWRLALWEIPYVYGPLGARARARARMRGREVARLTLGDALWDQLCGQGYLDVRSTHIPGLTYRVRVGQRVQLLWDHPENARCIPWPAHGYLCIQPTYPLPAVEFAAQLYLYLRDREPAVIRVAIPQAADGPVRRVF